MNRNVIDVLYGSDLERLTTSGFFAGTLERAVTADDIRNDVRAKQRLLDDAEVQPGAAVAILTEPASSFVVSFLAALSRGLIAVPLDIQQSDGELTRRVGLVGAEQLMADDSVSERLAWTTAAGLPVLGGQPAATRPAQAPAYPSDSAMVLFTSGSTGPSKAAMITHEGLIHNSLATTEWQRCTPNDVIAGTISLFHCFAILHTVLAPLVTGAAVVALAPFSPGKTIAAAQRHPLTMLPGTPAMFELLLRHPAVSEVDWHSLRCGFSGGAALVLKRRRGSWTRRRTAAQWLRHHRGDLVRRRSADRAARPGALHHESRPPECSVACANPTRDHDPALEIRGQSLMAGTSGPHRNEGGDHRRRLAATGDKVRISPDGELFYVGRSRTSSTEAARRSILSKSRLHSPTPPGFVTWSPFGVPDQILGERVAAIVESAAEDFDEAQLRDPHPTGSWQGTNVRIGTSASIRYRARRRASSASPRHGKWLRGSLLLSSIAQPNLDHDAAAAVPAVGPVR